MSKRNLPDPVAIRTIDLVQPLQDLTDIIGYAKVKLFITWANRLLGGFELENHYQPVSVVRLRQAIADNLALKVFDPDCNLDENLRWHHLTQTLANAYIPHAYAPDSKAQPFQIDLSQPLQPFSNAQGDDYVEIQVTWQDQPLGKIHITSRRQPISVAQLRAAIAQDLGLKLLEMDLGNVHPALWARVMAGLTQHYLPTMPAQSARTETLPATVPVSVVVATLDRPDDLRNCLRCLLAQASPRRIEIVVVDNNPASGLTPPVVAEFRGVVLVNEPRRGLAYARNAGFAACTGEIAIATDDDVTVPTDWVERLVAPFARRDVMVVTGNVLPLELDQPAQQLFEWYGGLGRGFQPFEVNGDWFEANTFASAPTWEVGATANAAFRTTIFMHPDIGLMEESLGPGMPAGVGEDTYLFYKVLKAGYTIVYEPAAYVWHRHRQTLAAFHRQIYNYSKGHVCYQLTLAVNDGDLRGLARIGIGLPKLYLWRFRQWWSDKQALSLNLIFLEMWGNFMGFGAFFWSRWRAKRWGRSAAYVPVEQRRGTKPQPVEAEALREPIFSLPQQIET